MTPMLSSSLNLFTELDWNDEFNNDLKKWWQDDFTENTWHRAGYNFLEPNSGEINYQLDGIKVAGRHAALMDKHRDKVQFINQGSLVLKPYVVRETNPYRDNFIGADGKQKPMGQFIPYTSWLSTWGSKWSNEFNRHVTDWNKTTKTFTKGSVIECRVNLENQVMQGVRFSMWPMPATQAGVIDTPDKPALVVAGDSYNNDSSIMEIDGPEVERPLRSAPNFGNNAFMKCIGGLAGDTPRPDENNFKEAFNSDDAYDVLKRFGINLHKGWHTFTIVWNLDGTLDFYCDGHLVNQEKRKVDYYAYLILSCEMCSGVKDPNENIASHEVASLGPRMPIDTGLSGRNWIDDINLVNQHEVRVDYVRIYKIVDRLNIDIDADKPANDSLASLQQRIKQQPVNQTEMPTLINKPNVDLNATLNGLATQDQVEVLMDLYEMSEKRLKNALQKNRQLISLRNKQAETINKLESTNINLQRKCDNLTKREANAQATVSKLNAEIVSRDLEPKQALPTNTANRLRDLIKRSADRKA